MDRFPATEVASSYALWPLALGRDPCDEIRQVFVRFAVGELASPGVLMSATAVNQA